MNSYVLNKLQDSEIYLYGISEKTKEIYYKYREILNIRACVTNYNEMKKKKCLDQEGVPTILIEDFVYTGKEYIIVCEEQLYDYYTCFMKVAKEALKYYGLLEYTQYVSYKAIEFLLEEKKLLLSCGSLLLGQVCQLLHFQDDLQDFYIQYYDEDHISNVYADDYSEYVHLAKFASVYIYAISDKAKSDMKILPKDCFQDNCRRIGISDFCFKALFPQINKERDYYSSYLLRKRERVNENYGRFFLAREDTNITELVLQGFEEQEIIEKILSTDFYSKETVKTFFENSIQRVREADAQADIKLASFLSDNIGTCVLNANLDEYNDEVVEYVSLQVMKLLNRRFLKSNNLVTARGTELLVYPSVAAYYGIEEITAKKKYRIYTYNSEKMVDAKEYVRLYVQSVRASVCLFETMRIGKITNENKVALNMQNSAVLYPQNYYTNYAGDQISNFWVWYNAIHVASKMLDEDITGSVVLAVYEKETQRCTAFFGALLSSNCYALTMENDMTKLSMIIKKLHPKAILSSPQMCEKLKKISDGLIVTNIAECQKVTSRYEDILKMKLKYSDKLPLYRKLLVDEAGKVISEDISYNQIADGKIKIIEYKF